jgi:DHA1 family bicyclomycin/chloramphenicol resistance-like MFS transporter
MPSAIRTFAAAAIAGVRRKVHKAARSAPAGSMTVQAESAHPPARRPRFAEFVGLVALMMGITAASIDILLPAFPAIEADLGIAGGNDAQLLVYVYMIGFAVTQLAFGPLSDILGRRPVLMGGLALYAVGSILALLAPSFAVLLAARAVQGLGAAAGRVLAVAIVRDCYAGREMARVMSLTIMVFILVPILAPSLGSVILLVGHWRLLFAVMLALALVLAIWFGLRMPETLHPGYRLAFSLRGIAAGFRATVTNRDALGYATAMGLMMGALMAYVGSAQQIFQTDVYALGGLFPLAFGSIAGAIALASFVNARLVRRLGMRRLSHAAVLGFGAAALLQLAIAIGFSGRPPLLLFCATLGLAQFLSSLAMPNFNAMAMEPLGAVAGTASSFIGFYTTLAGALLGLAIGQHFDGTVRPLAAGYVALSLAGIAVVLVTERGRLFRPAHPDQDRSG